MARRFGLISHSRQSTIRLNPFNSPLAARPFDTPECAPRDPGAADARGTRIRPNGIQSPFQGS
jgi:hypothetical protein